MDFSSESNLALLLVHELFSLPVIKLASIKLSLTTQKNKENSALFKVDGQIQSDIEAIVLKVFYTKLVGRLDIRKYTFSRVDSRLLRKKVLGRVDSRLVGCVTIKEKGSW